MFAESTPTVGSLPMPEVDRRALEDRVRAHLLERLPESLNLLRDLVTTNSFTRRPEGVNAVAERTATAFADLGFASSGVASAHPAYGDHLVLRREGTGPQLVGMVSHLDTVFTVAEEQANNFHWLDEGARIYGPGTIDIKGGTVMMWLVLDALRAIEPALFQATSWRLLFNAAEEELAADFGPLVREELDGAAACLVFEACRAVDEDGESLGPGSDEVAEVRVVSHRKGMATFDIEVHGRSSHAGGAHAAGANAIVQLARVIDRVAALTDYERELTVNVGVVQGGTVVNRVPHHATARLEMRAFDTEVLDDAIAAVRAIAETADVASAGDGFLCRIDARLRRRIPPWPANDASKGLAAIWEETAQQTGMALRAVARGGLSDGNLVWDSVPTLDGLGPHGGNMHASERDPAQGKEPEFVRPASFVPVALVNTLALRSLLLGRSEQEHGA